MGVGLNNISDIINSHSQVSDTGLEGPLVCEGFLCDFLLLFFFVIEGRTDFPQGVRLLLEGCPYQHF